MERGEVVELERLPGLAGARVAVRVGGGLERLDGDLVGLDVVGVRVAAVLVVGQHHVRPELADGADQRLGRLRRLQREAAIWQRRQRVALGQPGIGEAEELLLDAEDLPGPGHLLAPDAGQVGADLGPVHGLVQDVAALAAGQGADQDLHALAHIPGHGGGALARLVVGMRVHGHQPQLALQQVVSLVINSQCPQHRVRRCDIPRSGAVDSGAPS